MSQVQGPQEKGKKEKREHRPLKKKKEKGGHGPVSHQTQSPKKKKEGDRFYYLPQRLTGRRRK